MPNAFDPYREALVVEQETVWPADISGTVGDSARRAATEKLLHAEPPHVVELEYLRLHAGFQRRITVTSEDLERLKAKA